MLGAIVIDGMERYFPEIEKMKEKILILRDAELEPGSSSSRILKRAVQLAPYNCGAATGEPTRVFTVNGVVRPRIAIASGEKQFWRIVDFSGSICRLRGGLRIDDCRSTRWHASHISRPQPAYGETSTHPACPGWAG